MNDREVSKLPFESDDPIENSLWQALEDLPDNPPSAKLRPEFYRKLERENRASWLQKLNRWLGISNNMGWVTAAAFALIVQYRKFVFVGTGVLLVSVIVILTF